MKNQNKKVKYVPIVLKYQFRFDIRAPKMSTFSTCTHFFSQEALFHLNKAALLRSSCRKECKKPECIYETNDPF